MTIPVFPSYANVEPLVLSRPREEVGVEENNILILQWALPRLFSYLSIDCVLQIVGLLLSEVKLIVVCDQLSLLSAACLGLPNLLYPLKWAGPLITILPSFLHEYLEVECIRLLAYGSSPMLTRKTL